MRLAPAGTGWPASVPVGRPAPQVTRDTAPRNCQRRQHRGSPEVGSAFTAADRFRGMTSRPFSRRRTRIAVAIGAAVAVVGAGTAAAQAAGWLSAPTHDFGAAADSFSGHGKVTGNVLRNDSGATAVVRHTDPSDGTVTVNADGTFAYTPKSGFKGTDTFTYTTTDAVQLFKDTQVERRPAAAARAGRRPGRHHHADLR